MTTHWVAVYKDGSKLEQYNVKENTENLFKDIKQDKLFEFQLWHEGKIISLFIDTGTFGINGLLYDTDISRVIDCKYRLVNFIRRQKVLGNEDKNRTMYFMGFQATIGGMNYKRFIQVEDNVIDFIVDGN